MFAPCNKLEINGNISNTFKSLLSLGNPKMHARYTNFGEQLLLK